MGLELLKSVTGRTLIESHRGVMGRAPENSWTGIKLARELGADLIEVDVQISQDGVAFLRHNYQLPDKRWCNQLPWAILKTTLIENEPLPLLEDVLVWAKEKGVYLSLDLKTSFSTEGELSRAVVKSVQRTNAQNTASLLFLDHNELFQVKHTHPELTVRALVRGRLFNYAAYLQSIRADSADLSYDLFRPSDIEQLHAAGISVIFEGLWNPDADLFETYDIDVFTHDNPVEARKILNYQ